LKPEEEVVSEGVAEGVGEGEKVGSWNWCITRRRVPCPIHIEITITPTVAKPLVSVVSNHNDHVEVSRLARHDVLWLATKTSLI